MKIRNTINSFLRWINKSKFVIFSILVVVGVFFIPYIKHGLALESIVKIYGLVVQIIGIATVVYSIRSKYILFHHNGFVDLFVDWLKSSSSIDESSHSLKGTAKVDISVKSGIEVEKSKRHESIEHKFRYLNEKVNNLQQDLINTKSRFGRKFIDFEKSMSINNKEFYSRLQESNQVIKNIALSSVGSDLFGVVCIVFGLIYSTIPEYICRVID